jgi:DNA-binding CsgD family transcriptional regulator
VTVARRDPTSRTVPYHEPVATRVASPEFIGRQRELASLDDAVSRARSGDATVILVGGDAGIGKSRLVAEAARRARESGALVLEGGCIALGEGDGLPFAPIVEAFRRLPAIVAAGAIPGIDGIGSLRSSETSDLGRLLPELGDAPSPDARVFDRPDWVQARIFEGVLSLLRALGEHLPVVLIVEDLHWADSSTRDLLSFLVRNVRAERLAIIGTYRTDDLHRRHPLRPWLSEMERSPRVRRTEIARFDHAELTAQVGAILGHVPSARLVDAIAERAEGNPFFVEELLASGAEGATDRLPPTLRDVLLTRVTALPEDAQHILGIAAVAGRAAESALLAAVAGVDEPDIEGALREALAAQILVADDASGRDAYRFRHALLAEAVYDDLLPSERRRLHAAYAASLADRPVPTGVEGASQLAALAHHATFAHEPVRALHAWVGAARAAAASHAFGEAERAYEHAIDLWDAVPADDRPTDTDASALYFEASQAAMVRGRHGRAVDLARAAADALDPDRDLDRWAAANERLARATWMSGRLEDALAIFRQTADALVGTDPTPVRARVMAALASAYMLRGDHPTAIANATEAIEIARTAGARESEAHAMNTLGTSTAATGDCARGVAILREAFARTKDLHDVDDIGRAYANLSSMLAICGAAEEGLALALEGVAWARSVGLSDGYGRFIGNNACNAATHLGRWDEAERLADEAFAGDPVGVNRLALLGNAGSLFARRGRLADAERLLHEGRQLVEPLQESQMSGSIFVGLIEAALTQGRPDEAATIAADGVARLRRVEDRSFLGELLAMAARAEADRAEHARAARDDRAAASASSAAAAYRDPLASWMAEPAGRGAFAGLMAADAAAAEAEVRRAAGVADVAAWQAALDAAAASGSAWRTAYARYRVAEAKLLARAPRREAVAALSAAWSSADALGAAPLRGWIESLARRSRIDLAATVPVDERPAAEDAPAAPEPDDHGLTAREREVLALLAEGHTNKRIGELLFISESTAGVHVSNILGKLGVSSRTEAAAVATRLGLID